MVNIDKIFYISWSSHLPTFVVLTKERNWGVSHHSKHLYQTRPGPHTAEKPRHWYTPIITSKQQLWLFCICISRFPQIKEETHSVLRTTTTNMDAHQPNRDNWQQFKKRVPELNQMNPQVRASGRSWLLSRQVKVCSPQWPLALWMTGIWSDKLSVCSPPTGQGGSGVSWPTNMKHHYH